MPIKNRRGVVYAPPEAGIVKDRTSSVELRERTELPGDAGFLLAVSS